ncbi:beta-class carbonic anhydrase [Desmospora activa]|uniref:carbonic anhydrase n=1 Tax=Desmospora activa DSM 45169 TaxID=1121389 RepID=A0A2T4Z831_9BACL|nr:carbonic anhydrase [Desmospora activa]PTM58047.1 carbonic anhydrase [Desmospora activa DSM 45169]
MRILDQILAHNRSFVTNKEYLPYQTTKFPDKKMVVVTCMDTRLTELLPRAMNLKNGDTKIIKNAGAIVSHPFGSVMRSVLVALYELNAREVCVVGHYGCGMGSIQPEETLAKMRQCGISDDTITTLERSGIHLKKWLQGFASVEESVENSVRIIREHPLMLPGVPVHGLIIDPGTGELTTVVDGYQVIEKTSAGMK